MKIVLGALACLLVAVSARAGDPGIRVEAEAVPRRTYVGQRVTLTYSLVREAGPTGLITPVREVRLVEAPRFASFWVNELQVEEETSLPATAALRRFRLFPLLAGRLRVEPPSYAMLAYPTSIEAIDSSPEEITRAADAIEIEVLALPAAGRPASFGGAVGRFAVTATVGARGRAGEIARVEVEVRGDGNLEATGPPRLERVESDAGVQAFEARRASVDLGLTSPTGVGRSAWTLDVIPERAGPLALGAVVLDYFNPETGRYEVARSAPLTIEVAEGRVAAAPARPGATRGLGLAAWLGVATLATLALALGLLAVRAMRSPRQAAAPPRDERAEAETRAEVARLRARLTATVAAAEEARRRGDARAMHARLLEGLGDLMAARYDLAPSRLSRAAISARLAEEGVPPPVVERVARLYDHCLEAGYAPTAPDAAGAAPVEAAARLFEALVAVRPAS